LSRILAKFAEFCLFQQKTEFNQAVFVEICSILQDILHIRFEYARFHLIPICFRRILCKSSENDDGNAKIRFVAAVFTQFLYPAPNF